MDYCHPERVGEVRDAAHAKVTDYHTIRVWRVERPDDVACSGMGGNSIEV